jgi:hypothetical protein
MDQANIVTIKALRKNSSGKISKILTYFNLDYDEIELA